MKEESESSVIINTQYSLMNTLNFNKTVKNENHEILDKYISLIYEYKQFISENVSIKNKKYHTYIFTRGLDTITHVFTMLLFYTKSLDITYYHSQKSFYFYVEFIEQIIDIQNSFLKLSSMDATMFVYKKTIYEINNEYRKSIESSCNQEILFSTLNAYIQIYKNICLSSTILPTKTCELFLKDFNVNHKGLTRDLLDEMFLYVEKQEQNIDMIKLISAFHDITTGEKN
jgi:hypothetical protein